MKIRLIVLILFFSQIPFVLNAQLLNESKDNKEKLKELLSEHEPAISPEYIQAVVDTPRSPFLSESFKSLASSNLDLPVFSDAITPSPVLTAVILEAAEIKRNSSILVVGKATGYLGAAAAGITDKVTLAEFSDELYQLYPDIFTSLNITSITVENSIAAASRSGFMFDVVIVHGSTFSLSKRISSLLRPTGVLILPISGKSGFQNLLKIQYGSGLAITSIGESFFPLLSELSD